MLAALPEKPQVILSTAYSEYALKGYELEVTDYILKPFSFERFYKAVNKAREKFSARSQTILPTKLSVKSGKRIYQIMVEDIQFIETCGDYVTIFCADKKLVVHGTLKSWEEKLKGSSFLKVHRTTIVNLQKIDHIEGNMIQVGDHKLPVSEQFKEQLLEQLLGKNQA